MSFNLKQYIQWGLLAIAVISAAVTTFQSELANGMNKYIDDDTEVKILVGITVVTKFLPKLRSIFKVIGGEFDETPSQNEGQN